MRRVRCLVGFHQCEHHVNREKGRPGGGYDLCFPPRPGEEVLRGGGKPLLQRTPYRLSTDQGTRSDKWVGRCPGWRAICPP